jgi:hypothetical protein
MNFISGNIVDGAGPGEDTHGRRSFLDGILYHCRCAVEQAVEADGRPQTAAHRLTAKRSTDLALGVEFGPGKAAIALRRRVCQAETWCNFLVRKEEQMGGHTGRTEHTNSNRGLRWFGFLVGEPSNKPLKRMVGRGRPPTA